MNLNASLVLLLAACSFAVGQDESSPSLSNALSSNDQLSAFSSLLSEDYRSLVEDLEGSANITILAPNNDAIESLLQEDLSQEETQSILQYHILNFRRSLTQNSTSSLVAVGATSRGENVGFVSTGDDEFQIVGGLGQRVEVVEANVAIANGLVHIIDGVLTRPVSLAETLLATNLTALAGAIEEADLSDTVSELSGITLFAPSNDAFVSIGSVFEDLNAEQLQRTLSFHISNPGLEYSSADVMFTTAGPGFASLLYQTEGEEAPILHTSAAGEKDLFVENARIVTTDIIFSGGIIHVIDAVMNPESDATPNSDSEEPNLAFEGAEEASLPFTSGIPTPTATVSVPDLPDSTSTPSDTNEGLASGLKTTFGSVLSRVGLVVVLANL